MDLFLNILSSFFKLYASVLCLPLIILSKADLRKEPS